MSWADISQSLLTIEPSNGSSSQQRTRADWHDGPSVFKNLISLSNTEQVPFKWSPTLFHDCQILKTFLQPQLKTWATQLAFLASLLRRTMVNASCPLAPVPLTLAQIMHTALLAAANQPLSSRLVALFFKWFSHPPSHYLLLHHHLLGLPHISLRFLLLRTSSLHKRRPLSFSCGGLT